MGGDMEAGGGEAARRRSRDSKAIEVLVAALVTARSAAEADRLLAEGLLAMTGAVAVGVSGYDSQAGKLRVSHLAAVPSVLDFARRALGQPPESLDLRPGANLRTILEGPAAVELGGLREVFFGQVPEASVLALEHSLGIGRVYGLALRRGEELLRTATVFMPRGAGLSLPELAEWAQAIAAALPRKP